MQISTPKLKAMIRYFNTNTNPTYLGKVKLMKLFYFADFLSVKKYASPITYDNYVKLEHGPIPSSIKNLVDNVAEDPENAYLADTFYIERPEGTRMQKIVCHQNFSKKDEKLFTKHELEILEQVVQRFGDKTTAYIEEASHKEAPWTKTKMLDFIPYSLATYDADCFVNKDDIELSLSITN